MRELELAHKLWPDYARPYFSRGTVLYKLALEQFAKLAKTKPLVSTKNLNCFSKIDIAMLNTADLLQLALLCYDEALAASVRTPGMELELKIAFSRATIFLQQSDKFDADAWHQATEEFTKVIDAYEKANESRKAILRRIAAYAYARRGLTTICIPDCSNPLAKSNLEYRHVLADYQRALDLLQTPAGCKEDISRCYPSDQRIIEKYESQINVIQKYLEANN
jgi:hypothetical protein